MPSTFVFFFSFFAPEELYKPHMEGNLKSHPFSLFLVPPMTSFGPSVPGSPFRLFGPFFFFLGHSPLPGPHTIVIVTQGHVSAFWMSCASFLEIYGFRAGKFRVSSRSALVLSLQFFFFFLHPLLRLPGLLSHSFSMPSGQVLPRGDYPVLQC